MHLIDWPGLFKINNLVLGGKEFVTSLYGSLEEAEGERERERERERDVATKLWDFKTN